jgi:hypothetical protein
MGIVDTKTGKQLATAPVFVTVPANQQVQNFFTTTFNLNSDIPTTTDMTALVELGNQPCSVCKGTGKVTLNEWLLAKFQKNAFSEVQQVATTPFIQPDPIWPEAQIGQEYSYDQWAAEHPDDTDTP